MADFSDLGLSPATLAAVARMGYTQPTPVQEQAIPLVLEGRDVIAGAQTGTGKTAAFCLPAMDRLPHAKGGSGPLMLVVTPTRELAQQIGDVADQVALSTHHRITTVVGGLSYRPQIEKLARGTDILIATPGRLIDLMEQQAVRLAEVSVLVLDEADRMLDMGFLPSVRKIVAATPESRQTLLFSATIDDSVMGVVGSMLHDPATVEIARRGDVAETVDQYIIRITQGAKPALLNAVLQEKGWEKVIVFTRTRGRADNTCRRLKRAGYNAEAIHSSRTQNQRRRALDRFAAGEVNIICATDVLARGIDIDQVDYVVNYDIPEQPEDYVHRIGRTGRAGQRGFSVTFVTPDNRAELRDIQRMVKTDIPELALEHFDIAQAEADAAGKAQHAEARRDPEIASAKRELAKRARKKEKQREQAAEQAASPKQKRSSASAKKAASPKKQKPEARAPEKAPKAPSPQKQAQDRAAGNASAKAAPRTDRKQRRTHGAAGKTGAPTARPARAGSKRASGDFRPGRARRAEVDRQRRRTDR